MLRPPRTAWNNGRIVGQKQPLLLKHVWTIRIRLELGSAGSCARFAAFWGKARSIPPGWPPPNVVSMRAGVPRPRSPVLGLVRQDIAIDEIVRRTGRSRKVVPDIVRGGRAEPVRPRASSLEPFLARLDAEWSSGRRTGAEL